MKKNTLRNILLFLLCFPLTLFSQISPPDFLCVSMDYNLFWDYDTNTCGSFLAYEIYVGENENGPYSLVTIINDKNTLSYLHENQNGPRYYFLQSQYDCPGQTPISSDTLNNLPPGITKIESVSVEDDNVLVRWQPNNEPSVIGYIIYRNTPIGTIPIDTIYDDIEYLDSTANPGLQPEIYYILTLDACGNTSTFDTPHETILLNAEIEFCEKFIKLTWTPYLGWENRVENYEIWLSKDGGPLAFEHRVSGTDTLAYVLDISDSTEFCLAIRALETATNAESFSNTICILSNVINSIEFLEIRNITINSNQQVEINWHYNTNAELDLIELWRGNSVSGLINQGVNILELPVFYNEDTEADPDNEPYYYQFKVLDQCGNRDSSNIVSTILLEVAPQDGGSNLLNWTSLFFPGRDIATYQICRISGGTETLLHTISASAALMYLDAIDPNDGSLENCYLIKAIHTNPSGSDTLISQSNIACSTQEVEMYIPNAFVPGGTNSIFKPEIVFQQNLQSFRLQIFNRWGGQVFESSTPQSGWDGAQDGKLSEPGVYFYVITLEQEGKSSTRSGTINLIR